MTSVDSVKQFDFYTKLLIAVVNQKHKSNNNKTLGYLNSSVIKMNHQKYRYIIQSIAEQVVF